MTAIMTKNWIAVASADHARRGRDETVPGFMQVGHGKLGPLEPGAAAGATNSALACSASATMTCGGLHKGQFIN